jgi:hypothetical protein
MAFLKQKTDEKSSVSVNRRRLENPAAPVFLRTKWRSNGQAMPALGAASANHRTAPAGSHPDEKTMSAFAADY